MFDWTCESYLKARWAKLPKWVKIALGFHRDEQAKQDLMDLWRSEYLRFWVRAFEGGATPCD